MKKDIHPTYFPEAKIICACGKVYKFQTKVSKKATVATGKKVKKAKAAAKKAEKVAKEEKESK
jgi:ribosomal protein L31